MGLLVQLNQTDINDASKMWSELRSRFEAAMTIDKQTALSDAKKVPHGDRMKPHNIALRSHKAAYHSAGGQTSDEQWRDIILSSLMGPFKVYVTRFLNIDDPEVIIKALILQDLRIN